MREKLPISIHVHEKLIAQFHHIKSVTSKLEAQFNFQTMTANWYGDEANIPLIQLHLETPESFINAQQCQTKNIITFSDDVFCIDEKPTSLLRCYIALTATELTLLTEQQKVLAALLQVKLLKVINLIAKERHLTLI